MIVRSRTPMKRAASTNSFSRSETVVPRTIRALIIHRNAAISSTSSSQDSLARLGERIAMIRNEGMTSSRSTPHISARSHQPPR